jgi:hypothetical protein
MEWPCTLGGFQSLSCGVSLFNHSVQLFLISDTLQFILQINERKVKGFLQCQHTRFSNIAGNIKNVNVSPKYLYISYVKLSYRPTDAH